MTRKVYGIAEIAQALGVKRQTVAQWHHRGKLPPADEELSMGPVWFAETIEPWIKLQMEVEATRRRAQMAGDKAKLAAIKAYDAAEEAGLPSLYCLWASYAAQAHANGVSAKQWRWETIAGRGPEWEKKMDDFERVMREKGLWPWKDE